MNQLKKKCYVFRKNTPYVSVQKTDIVIGATLRVWPHGWFASHFTGTGRDASGKGHAHCATGLIIPEIRDTIDKQFIKRQTDLVTFFFY